MICRLDDTNPVWTKAAVVVDRLFVFITAVLMFAVATGSRLDAAQLAAVDKPISFNIPAQPLSRALIAYGAATGFEIFYKWVLAEHQSSVEVVGTLTPPEALRILLGGTGYAARITEAGDVIIEEAPSDAAGPAPAAATRRRLEPYFAAIQERINDALCQTSGLPGNSREITVQFWLEPRGVIARAEVLADNGEPAADQAVAVAMRGLRVAAPPVGMPQPLSMVIFPPSSRLESCAAGQTQRRAG
jgi:TonB family protein